MSSCNDENRTSGLSLRQAAVVAGFTYLLNPVTFAEAYVMPRLVSTDPAETVRNLTVHPHLFSAAVLSYVISAVGDVVMSWALYVLLQPINRALAMLGSVLQLVYAAAWLAALSNLGLIHRLVAVPAYARHTSTAGLPSQIAELLGAYYSGWGLSLVLFGLHLVVTGWLIARSSYLPRWLGWLLFLAGWAWVVDSVALYFVPEPHLSFLKVIFAAELIFMVWLLGWGWRITEPQFLDQGAAMTQRAESKWAGYAYLAYIVFAMAAAILSRKTTAGEDTSQMLSTLRSTIALAQISVLLDLLQIVCAVVLAVTLYRLSRTVDATLALLAMAFRFGEGMAGFVPLLGKLELMKLATASNPTCASSAGCLVVAGEIFNRPDDLFGQFCFVIGGFLFAYLLLAGRLIPRWMAWTGVITVGLQLICVPMYVATLLPGKVVNWLWLPILLYEVPLGILLIRKGVRATA